MTTYNPGKKWERSYNARLGLMLASSVLIMLALGSYYTIGNITPYMISYLRFKTNDTTLRNVDALWITSIGSLTNCVGTMTGGLMYKRYGPRIVTFLGSAIFGATVMMSSLTIQTSLFFVIISYGVISSFGTSMAYGALVQTAVKWVPHRPSLAVGTIVAAYGGSSVIFNQVITGYINPSNLSPDCINEDGDRYFTQPGLLDRVPTCFIILGACFLCMSILGVFGIQLPPDFQQKMASDQTSDSDDFSSSNDSVSNGNDDDNENKIHLSKFEDDMNKLNKTQHFINNNRDSRYKYQDFINENECLLPRNLKNDVISYESTMLIYKIGDNEDETKYGSLDKMVPMDSDETEYKTIVIEEIHQPDSMSVKEAFKTAFTSRAFVILWVSMLMYDGSFEFIIGLYKAYGETFIKDDRFLAIVGSVSSVFNCIGRPIWGHVMDRFGYKITMRCLTGGFVLTAATMILIEQLDKAFFLIWICLLYFFFAGFLAVAPSSLSKLFGPNNTAVTYGLLLIAQSLASINSAVVGITLKGIIGWHGLFFLAAGMAAIPFILSFFFNGRDHNGIRF